MGNPVKQRLIGVFSIMFVLASPLMAGAAGLPIDEARGGIPTLAPILEQRAPGVVNIAVTGTAQLRTRNGDTQQRRVQGQGSGVIVDAGKGYVLTNNHVVANATGITVTLNDGRKLDATVVGRDDLTDIAVIKVNDPDRLTAVPFGEPEKLKVGDFVIAIGNPFGLGQTVTSGIISALGRAPGLTGEGYEDFIQTDASINPGNSGGALIDLTGKLIGINTAIIGPSEGNVGIGFAVPVDIARAVMEQIIKYGDVKRGRLGIEIDDVPADQIARIGSTGATVKSVLPGSIAEKAGLSVDDVIVRFNGAAVRGGSDLRNKVGLTRIGNTVKLELLRNGKRQVVEVKLSETQDL